MTGWNDVELERDRVVAGRQVVERVVSVRRRGGGTAALERRGFHRDGDPRQGRVPRRDVPGERRRGQALAGGHPGAEDESQHRRARQVAAERTRVVCESCAHPRLTVGSALKRRNGFGTGTDPVGTEGAGPRATPGRGAAIRFPVREREDRFRDRRHRLSGQCARPGAVRVRPPRRRSRAARFGGPGARGRLGRRRQRPRRHDVRRARPPRRDLRPPRRRRASLAGEST